MNRSWISKIESGTGFPLPDELRELYDRADGEFDSDCEGRPLRLMRSAEVIADFGALRDSTKLRSSCPFWVGWNGDHAAIFLDGPLIGRIYFWDHVHDYADDAVAYRSVKSLLDSMNAAAEEELDWYQMPTDYYVGNTDYFVNGAAICKEAKSTDIEADREALGELRNEYATAKIDDEYDDKHFAYNIMALTPLDETESVTDFLNSDDMYIQARACEVIGNRKFLPAIERLGHTARHARGNGQSAALAALGKIGTADALNEIVQGIPSFAKGMHHWIANAIQECGCSVRWEDDKFRTRHFQYQLPETDQWHKIE
jgi:hypothetical protein